MGEGANVKHVSRLRVWALALGCIIGWGAFVMPGTTFLPEAGPLGTIIAVSIAAFLMLIIAANYSYLTRSVPGEGGSYIYAKTILGHDHGFLAVWSVELAYISLLWANSTAFTMMARYVVGDALQWGFHYRVANFDVYCGEIVTTVILHTVLVLIMTFAPEVASSLRTWFGMILFASVVALLVGLFIHEGIPHLEPAFSDGHHVVRQVVDLVVLAPWMFVGFEVVTSLAGRVDLGPRRIFRVAGVAILCGALIYITGVLLSVASTPEGYKDWTAYIAHMGELDGLAQSPVFYNAYAIMGRLGLILVIVAALSALTSSVLGFYKASVHILTMMAEDELVPKSLAMEKRGVPRRAILVIYLICLPIPLLGRTAIGWNADVSTMSVSIVYAYISLCSFLTARKSGNLRQQVVGIVGTIISVIFFGLLLIPNIFTEDVLSPECYFMLSIWSLAGILYYWYVFRRDKVHRFGKSTIMWMMMLFVLFFSSSMWMRLSTKVQIQEVVGVHQKITAILIRNNLVQMAVMCAAMYVLFSMFHTMREREKEMDYKILQAEARSKTKSQFLSNMSHDIRTPMNAILGYTELALDHPEDTKQVERYLENIKVSGDHLLSLINNILEMGRIESGHLELSIAPVNLREMMQELSAIVHAQAMKKKQHLKVDVDIVDENIMADKLKLNQVLLNLTSNAIKYTPDGGHVELRVSQLEHKEGRGRYYFLVKDDGVGMSPEFVDKVYEAFEREYNADMKAVQGTGLGMAITKSIVDLMGGTISMNTAPGEGTEFSVILDFDIAADGVDTTKKRATISEEQIRGLRVLVVDDMEINREILSHMLKNMGLDVEQAGSGVETLRLLNSGENYDFILMDVHMPQMDGYETTRRIRALGENVQASVPIYAVTADAFEEDRQRSLAAGMNGHLSKPINREELLEILADVITKQ